MINSIDHIVLVSKNINETVYFYTKILEMKLKKEFFKEDNSTRYSLHFGVQKINIHELNNIFKPHAFKVMPGTLDICFISKKKISYWKKKLEKNKIKIIAGPVNRSGAINELLSIYVRDPDSNLIEISNYINIDA